MSGSKILLIDGPPLLYKHGSNPNYKSSVDEHFYRIFNDCGTDKYIGFLEKKRNFRKAMYPTYKGSRSKKDLLERHPFFYRVKDYLLEQYGFYLIDNIEADDAVSILSNRLSKPCIIDGKEYKSVDRPSIVVSIDKDLLQIPSLYYNLNTGVFIDAQKEMFELNSKRKLKATGFKLVYAQLIMGDPVDDVKGIPRCGDVTAYKALKDCKTEMECYNEVLKLYKSYFPNTYEAELKKNFTLLSMLKVGTNFPEVKVSTYKNKFIHGED